MGENDRDGKYPDTLTAPCTREMRAAVDDEAERQGGTMSDLLRALVQRAIEKGDWPKIEGTRP